MEIGGRVGGSRVGLGRLLTGECDRTQNLFLFCLFAGRYQRDLMISRRRADPRAIRSYTDLDDVASGDIEISYD